MFWALKLCRTGKDIAAVVLGGSISAGGDTHVAKKESYFAQATVRPPPFPFPTPLPLQSLAFGTDLDYVICVKPGPAGCQEGLLLPARARCVGGATRRCRALAHFFIIAAIYKSL